MGFFLRLLSFVCFLGFLFPSSKTRICANMALPFSFRIAVFSVSVFYDERIVVVAEQRPDASEEDSFQWMSRVLQVSPLT